MLWPRLLCRRAQRDRQRVQHGGQQGLAVAARAYVARLTLDRKRPYTTLERRPDLPMPYTMATSPCRPG